MNPQDVESAALDKIAARCRYDLFYLCKYILGYELMEPHVHQELCDYTTSLLPNHPNLPETTGKTEGLESQFDPRNKNLLLLMPRGTFKSSVVTIGFSLQMLLNDPDIRILIDSETFGKSKAFLSEIKGHLEQNEKYRAIFKHIHGVYPNGTEERKNKDLLWSDSQINIQARKRWRKEPTLSCAGIDVTKNGMHYDLIICDDLHSEKNVTNKEQIEQVIEHFRLAYSLLDPGCPIIIIGTRWHFLDLYQHILDNERDDFNILIKRAINHDGSLLFPERLTLQFLEAVKRKQGTGTFSKQYLNEPVDDENATFKRSHFVRKPWELVKDRPMNWYMSVDPSYGGEYSDYTAIVVAGMDHQRQLYVRHILRAKMTYSEIIQNMFEINSIYKPKVILLETLGSQKSIMYELNNQQKIKGAWLPIQEIRQRPVAKEERIRALAPFYEFGRIFHIRECPQLDDLEYELATFPSSKHDDVVDALSSILEVATAPSSHKTSDTIKEKRRVLYKPRSIITGV